VINRDPFYRAELEAYGEYYAGLRRKALEQNMLLGRPIMESAEWEKLDTSARYERVQLATLATHTHEIALHYPICINAIREKLWERKKINPDYLTDWPQVGKEVGAEVFHEGN